MTPERVQFLYFAAITLLIYAVAFLSLAVIVFRNQRNACYKLNHDLFEIIMDVFDMADKRYTELQELKDKYEA